MQLRSLIVTAPDELRNELRRLPLGELLRRCSRFRRSSSRAPDQLATILVLRSLAQRIQAATQEADELEREILAHVRALAPTLLDEPGIGPIVAAQLIVTWSHHGRDSSEAASARLAGVAPLPRADSLTRHRLSRGGDRQLNRALHMILVTRKRTHPAIAYIERRLQEGKTRREANRCLKRYLARTAYSNTDRLGECPTICVGMDRKEIHVIDNPKQVGGVLGSFRRRRGAERARRASAARRGRRAPEARARR